MSLEEESNGFDVTFKRGTKAARLIWYLAAMVFILTCQKIVLRRGGGILVFPQNVFSITIVDKMLIRENTTQMYNEPGKAVYAERL